MPERRKPRRKRPVEPPPWRTTVLAQEHGDEWVLTLECADVTVAPVRYRAGRQMPPPARARCTACGEALRKLARQHRKPREPRPPRVPGRRPGRPRKVREEATGSDE